MSILPDSFIPKHDYPDDLWHELGAHMYRMGCFYEVRLALVIARDTALQRLDELPIPLDKSARAVDRALYKQFHNAGIAVVSKRLIEWAKEEGGAEFVESNDVESWGRNSPRQACCRQCAGLLGGRH